MGVFFNHPVKGLVVCIGCVCVCCNANPFLISWFTQEVTLDWQQAASNILVAVGNKYINDIMEEILTKFQPGILPHFFVVQTLANLSDSNGKYPNSHEYTHSQRQLDRSFRTI